MLHKAKVRRISARLNVAPWLCLTQVLGRHEFAFRENQSAWNPSYFTLILVNDWARVIADDCLPRDSWLRNSTATLMIRWT